MRSASGPPAAPRGGRTPDDAAAFAAIDLVGQRWILRIVWELEPGPLGFLALRRRMDNCSSSILSERLNRLAAAGVVDKNGTGAWQLTDTGHRLWTALSALWVWARPWHARLQ